MHGPSLAVQTLLPKLNVRGSGVNFIQSLVPEYVECIGNAITSAKFDVVTYRYAHVRHILAPQPSSHGVF